MLKYQKVEKVHVLTDEERDKIAINLEKIGRTSVQGLNDKERSQVLKSE